MSRLVTLIRRRLRSPEDYRALQAYLAERSIAQLARRGVDLSGLRVLEVAAAYGGYSEALHARASLLVASDLHADPHFGRAGIPFVQLDASDTLPFCDGAFDLVYCSSLIEHLPAPQGLLAECRRVLRPRGQLYLTFPPFYSLFLVGGHGFKPFHLFGERFALWATNRLRGTAVTSYADCYGDYGLFPRTIGSVRAMLSGAGFADPELFTRLTDVNTARLPGLLADLLTWHVCYLAEPKPASEPPRAG
jgi:SAM-dependent methyltransferase